MRVLRSRALFLTALLLVGSSHAGAEEAATETPARKKVKLRLEVPAKSIRGMQAAAERAVLDAFRAKHPEIEIEPHVKLRMAGPRGEATFYMSMAGQTAPDALYVYGRSTQKYIDQNFLYPLNEYLTDEIRNDPVFKKFYPAISRDGKVYGIPALVAVSGLLYRKDLFSQAGLDPERPPKTWEELLDYARKLTYPDRGQFGIALPGGRSAGWRFVNFVWQAGGNVVRFQDDKWRLTLDEPPAIRALEFYKEMCWGKWTRDGKEMQGCMRVDSTDQIMLHFNEGRAAMTVISTTGDVGRYLQAGLDPSQVGIAPLPAGPGGQASMLEGEFWGINQLIAHDKARRDAAWEYIHFLVSDRAKAIKTRTQVEAGWAMSVNPKWLEKFGYRAELTLMPAAWIDLYDRIVEHGRLEPYAPGYDQVATDLLAKLDAVLYTEKSDPKAVLEEITSEANSRFFGTIPEETKAHRRRVAGVIFGLLMVLVAALLALLAFVWRRRRQRELERERELLIETVETPGKLRMRRRIEFLAWMFMLPAVLTVLIWMYYPLVRGAVLAFMDYRILGGSTYVGLDNFIEAFLNPSFWLAFGQTVIYAGTSLGLGFFVPILLALMLSEIPYGKMFFRTVFYLPAITSGLVVMFIWKMLYDNSAQGIYNRGLMWLTTDGRWLLFGMLLAAWLLVVGMLTAAAVGIAGRHRKGMVVLPLLVLVVLSPLWLYGVSQIVIGLYGPEWLTEPVPIEKMPKIVEVLRTGTVTTFVRRVGGEDAALSTPVTFVAEAAGRALLVVLTVGAVRLLLGRPKWVTETVGPRRWVVPVTAGAAMTVMAGSLLFRTNLLVLPLARPYPWLSDPNSYWAMLWVIIPSIWARMGPGCIIYLAALKSIPEDLYEAADVDGAGPLSKIYHVTFQYLKPLIIINFVGAFIGTFHAMQNILVMTGGGPGTKTMTIGMDIFFNAFTHLKFGYATAEAWILGSLLIGFTLYQLRILKKLRFTRAE